ncbi:hypothetical protein GCM10007416_31660 [Kroppenstedtia guangzhouensis]|uniref:PD-(D/E)XK endonuclease-like domain-containing protein n=1 Tax=Kroppenstedtia guangzhouensis TaxID=1274356 RepID=A0ABQ1H335_9BACL|nr:PD-(D/E)XK nuclease family protein [Kroppenstedtia guangzhouensis]GGA56146.1 hypothetical protein GCM10007416_31660 [Kroppenstedtia guangzhouensis]
MIYSFSRLHLYEQCPFRFRLKYIEGWKEPVTKSLALGKAVHEAIEAVIGGDGHSESVLKGWIAAEFHPEVSQDEVSELVKQAPIQRDMGETEVYFRLPLSSSPSAPEIQGYIDLVMGNMLVDWKTNWQPYHVLVNHQMGLYAWVVSQLAKVDEVEGSLYFLRFQRESRHTFNHQDMERSRQWALDLAESIEKNLFLLDTGLGKADDLFPATPSGSCQHCPFAVECYRKNVRM